MGDKFTVKCSVIKRDGRSDRLLYHWCISHRNGSQSVLERKDKHGKQGKLKIIVRGDGYVSPEEHVLAALKKAKQAGGKERKSKVRKESKRGAVAPLELGFSLDDCEEEFRNADKDHDGLLTKTELARLFLRSGASKQTAHQLSKDFFKIADVDNTGFVDFYEMAAEYQRMQMYRLIIWIRKNVDYIDKDHDGYLSLREIVHAARKQVGKRTAKAITKELMKNADADGDGHLSMEEISAWYYTLEQRAKSSRTKSRKKKKKRSRSKKARKKSEDEEMCLILDSDSEGEEPPSLLPKGEAELEAALESAKSECKLLLVHISRHGCNDCATVKRFYSSIRGIKHDFVFLEVDVDAEKWFWKQYQIDAKALPFIVVAEPVSNRPICQRFGYSTQGEIEHMLRKAKKAVMGDSKGPATHNAEKDVDMVMAQFQMDMEQAGEHLKSEKKMMKERLREKMKARRLKQKRQHKETKSCGEKIGLAAHNQLRALHKAPPLEWSAKCQESAETWAKQLAREGRVYHGDHDDVGENIAMSSDKLTADQAVQLWYDQVAMYDFAEQGYSCETGHFTQLVWGRTTHVGVAMAQGSAGIVVVAHYYPAGNIQGKFMKYVKKSQKRPKLGKLKENDKLFIGPTSQMKALTDVGFSKSLAREGLYACNGEEKDAVRFCLRRCTDDRNWVRRYDKKHKSKIIFLNKETGEYSYGAPGTTHFQVKGSTKKKKKKNRV